MKEWERVRTSCCLSDYFMMKCGGILSIYYMYSLPVYFFPKYFYLCGFNLFPNDSWWFLIQTGFPCVLITVYYQYYKQPPSTFMVVLFYMDNQYLEVSIYNHGLPLKWLQDSQNCSCYLWIFPSSKIKSHRAVRFMTTQAAIILVPQRFPHFVVSSPSLRAYITSVATGPWGLARKQVLRLLYAQ